MTKQKPDKAKEAASKAPVEVDEKDLDQAAGGVLIGLLQPADSFSLNYTKVETAVKPTYDLSSGVAGPHVTPETKG